MNQTRSFLLIAWLFAAAYLFMQWNKAPVAPAAAPATTVSSASVPASALPPVPAPASGTAMPLPASATASAIGASPSPTAAQPIILANDRLRLTIDPAGGRVLRAQLLQYRLEKKTDSPNVVLLDDAPGRTYVADAGLLVADAQQRQHEMPLQFHTASGDSEFTLAPGATSVSLPLLATDPATGISVSRTLTLRRGGYVLELQDAIANTGAKAQQVYPFVRLSRIAPPPPPKHSFATNPDSFSF